VCEKAGSHVSFETVTDQNTEQMLMRYIENMRETWGREWR